MSPDMNGGDNEEAIIDSRRPDISLIDSDVVPTKYLWLQCAVFMEVKKSAWDGPFRSDPLNAQLSEDAHVVIGSRLTLAIDPWIILI